jgi:hypothetical protein
VSYTVLSVNQSQNIDAAGDITDVFEITFSIDGRTGSFTDSVPTSGDPVASAKQALDDLEAQIEAIYGLT